MPACNRPMRRHPVKGWPRDWDRVAIKPLEVALQHRPGPPHTTPTGSCGIGRGLPLNVVRVAPLHDAGITAQPKPHAEICTLWAKLHSHACRGASRRSCPLNQSANAKCVHDLFRFVKPARRQAPIAASSGGISSAYFPLRRAGNCGSAGCAARRRSRRSPSASSPRTRARGRRRGSECGRHRCRRAGLTRR